MKDLGILVSGIEFKIRKLIKTEGEKDTEVKLRINELVREIDKCLGLLNQ